MSANSKTIYLNLNNQSDFIWTKGATPSDDDKNSDSFLPEKNPPPSLLDIVVENDQLIYIHLGATLPNWYFDLTRPFKIERAVSRNRRRRRRKNEVRCDLHWSNNPGKKIILHHIESDPNPNRQTSNIGLFKFDLILENRVFDQDTSMFQKITKVIIDPVIINGGGGGGGGTE